MNLQIGTCSDDARTVDKTFTVSATLSGQIKNNTSIIEPVFIITTPASLNINYCYCEDFGRYYFVDNIEVMQGGMIAISCRVDVLMSYSSGIKNLSCIIDKQESAAKSNLYRDDGSFVTINKAQNDVINFPNGFNNEGEFILIVAGA